MMRVKIRLYRVHDYDLFCLYKTVGPREFSHMVKDILRCYIQQIPYGTAGITVNPYYGEAAPVTCHLQLEDRLVQETALLQGVQDYKRPAFIKMILRAYLIDILAPVYLGSAGTIPAQAGNPSAPRTVARSVPSTAALPPQAQQAAQSAASIPLSMMGSAPAPTAIPDREIRQREDTTQAQPAAETDRVNQETGHPVSMETPVKAEPAQAMPMPHSGMAFEPDETEPAKVSPAVPTQQSGRTQEPDDIGDLAELFGGLQFG